jgi:hypothetical protein
MLKKKLPKQAFVPKPKKGEKLHETGSFYRYKIERCEGSIHSEHCSQSDDQGTIIPRRQQ